LQPDRGTNSILIPGSPALAGPWYQFDPDPGSVGFSRTVIAIRLLRAVRAQVLGDRRVTAVFGPADRRRLVDRVGDVEARAALDEQAHDGVMVGERRLVQRRGMRVPALRVVAVRILAGVEQQPHDLSLAKLR